MCCFFHQGANSGLLLSSEGGDYDFMTLTMSPMSLFGRKKKHHSHLNHRQSKVSGPNGDLSGVYRLHPGAPGGHFPEDCKDSCVYRWLPDGSEVAKIELVVSCPLILTIGSLCRSSSLSIIISTERRVKQCTIRRNEVRKGLNGGKNEEREKKNRVFMDKHFYVKRIKDILLKRNCIGPYLSGGRMTRAGPTTASCLSL